MREKSSLIKTCLSCYLVRTWLRNNVNSQHVIKCTELSGTFWIILEIHLFRVLKSSEYVNTWWTEEFYRIFWNNLEIHVARYWDVWLLMKFIVNPKHVEKYKSQSAIIYNDTGISTYSCSVVGNNSQVSKCYFLHV